MMYAHRIMTTILDTNVADDDAPACALLQQLLTLRAVDESQLQLGADEHCVQARLSVAMALLTTTSVVHADACHQLGLRAAILEERLPRVT